MRYPPFLSMLLVAIGIGLAACGSSTEGDADTADDARAQDGAPQDEAALMKQAAIEAGIPIPDVEIPVVSARTYKTGHVQLKVSGHFDIDASPALDTQASISDGGYTWITYGTSG